MHGGGLRIASEGIEAEEHRLMRDPRADSSPAARQLCGRMRLRVAAVPICALRV